MRPTADLSVSGFTAHSGRSGNSNVSTNKYALISDTEPYDGATTYIAHLTEFTNNASRTSTYITNYKLGFVDSSGKPVGKIRLNSITALTTYVSCTHENTSNRTNTTYFGVSIDGSNYTYSTKYNNTGNSSNAFATQNLTVSMPSNTLGKIYDSIDDLDINLMVITYQYTNRS